MKTKDIFVLVLLLSVSQLTQAASVGTAFTYQGRLSDGNGLANGSYDLRFTLFNGAVGGGQVGGTQTIPATLISNGLFAVSLDFGAGVFDGTAYWLEIAVRTNGAGLYTTNSPRQSIAPSPYALFALATKASVNNTNTGSYTTVGGGYGNTASGFSTTIGGGRQNTANNEGSTVGGGILNKSVGYASTVAGGYLNCASNTYSTVGGGFENASTAESATVAGGYGNTSSATRAFVGGGSGNHSSGQNAVISGGAGNTASNGVATVGGGTGNTAGGLYSTIGGGGFNSSIGYAAIVPGGYQNDALGDYSFAAGRRAKALNAGSFVWADSSNADFSSTQSNQFLIRASGGVGIGTSSPSTALSVFGDGDFSGKLGVGMLPNFGLDVNHELVVYDHAIAFRRNNAHRWVLEEFSNSGLRFRQGYNDAEALVNRVRLELADNGNVGVGVTDPGFTLDVGGRARVRDGAGLTAGIWFQTAHSSGSGGVADIGFFGVLDPTRIGFYGNDPRGGPGWGLTFDTLTGNVGIGTGVVYPTYKLQVNGSVAGVGAYNNISDARYKTNVVTLRGALNTVQQLRGVRYDWRDKEFSALNFEHGPQLGFIAQEVKEVLPEAVSVDSEGIQSIAYSKIIPVLVEAIKEQQQQKDARINALEKDLAALKELVAKLASTQK